MKKRLLALLTAALVLTACQKEDTVTENSAGESTPVSQSVSDTVETSGTPAEISEIILSEKVTEHTASESGTELAEESAETEETADETLLQTAMRKAGDMDEYTSGRIFIDLNFDGFPEMIKCYKYDNGLYTFNTETCKWELFAVTGSKLYLYNDEERGKRFYFFIEYSDYDGAPIIERLELYSDNTFVGEVIGIADVFAENYLGIPDAYVDKDLGKIVAYQHTNGAFAVGEFDGYSDEVTEFYYSVAEKGLEEYTLERIINIDEITAGVDRSQKFEIFAEEFFDEPQENSLPQYVKDENKNSWIPNSRAFLDANKMNEEAFAKLAENKKLTYLIISANDDDVLDFNGIGRLENLKELVVAGSGKSFINTAEIGKLKNLEVLYIPAELNNYDFLSELDSLKIIQFDNTNDKPADFFKPIYGMKNLRYLLVFVWDPNITTEQVEELEKNMPQLCICYYKRG